MIIIICIIIIIIIMIMIITIQGARFRPRSLSGRVAGFFVSSQDPNAKVFKGYLENKVLEHEVQHNVYSYCPTSARAKRALKRRAPTGRFN